jgi:hypothetical protein
VHVGRVHSGLFQKVPNHLVVCGQAVADYDPGAS